MAKKPTKISPAALIRRVSEQLRNNWPVDARDIQEMLRVYASHHDKMPAK